MWFVLFQFEESYNAMLAAFDLFDYLSDGYISRVDFRRVLQEFGLNISVTDLDNFLARWGQHKGLYALESSLFLAGLMLKCGFCFSPLPMNLCIYLHMFLCKRQSHKIMFSWTSRIWNIHEHWSPFVNMIIVPQFMDIKHSIFNSHLLVQMILFVYYTTQYSWEHHWYSRFSFRIIVYTMYYLASNCVRVSWYI